MNVILINDSDLTDKNFLLFAARHYDNPNCQDMDEFYTDLLIPMHLKKLFTRYKVNGTLKERLMINHVISLFNVFDSVAAVKILFYKIESKYYSYIKTILVFLGRCPSNIVINGNVINISNIPIDENLLQTLEKSASNYVTT